MTPASRWRFHGDGLVIGVRDPPIPDRLEGPINSLLAEATGSRAATADFLELWREQRYRNDPEDALTGDHVEIHIVGDMVHVYALYDEQWGDVEDAWFTLAEVEEMFAAYQAWAWGSP